MNIDGSSNIQGIQGTQAKDLPAKQVKTGTYAGRSVKLLKSVPKRIASIIKKKLNNLKALFKADRRSIDRQVSLQTSTEEATVKLQNEKGAVVTVKIADDKKMTPEDKIKHHVSQLEELVTNGNLNAEKSTLYYLTNIGYDPNAIKNSNIDQIKKNILLLKAINNPDNEGKVEKELYENFAEFTNIESEKFNKTLQKDEEECKKNIIKDLELDDSKEYSLEELKSEAKDKETALNAIGLLIELADGRKSDATVAEKGKPSLGLSTKGFFFRPVMTELTDNLSIIDEKYGQSFTDGVSNFPLDYETVKDLLSGSVFAFKEEGA